jgi:hypothetical protein
LAQIINKVVSCQTTGLELLNEDDTPMTELIASIKDNTIAPLDPNLNKDYNFKVRIQSADE